MPKRGGSSGVGGAMPPADASATLPEYLQQALDGLEMPGTYSEDDWLITADEDEDDLERMGIDIDLLFAFSDDDGNAYNMNGDLLPAQDTVSMAFDGNGIGVWSEDEQKEYLSLAFKNASPTDIANLRGALKAWTGGFVDDINNNPVNKAAKNILDKFASNGPTWQGETFRGLSVNREFINSISANKEFKTLGIASWTSQKAIAVGFAGTQSKSIASATEDIPLVIKCRNQSRGTALGRLSDFPNQYEVLVSSKSRYRYTSTPVLKTNAHGQQYYEVEVKEI